MKKIAQIIGVCLIASMSIGGAFMFGHELKKSSDIKQKREAMKFKRDSLQVILYKKELSK
jgi:hypothetical protein